MPKVKVSNPSNEEVYAEVYALLDSGSQRSFVTDRLAGQLNVFLPDNDKLILHTFAAQESTRYILPKAELNLHLNDGARKTLQLNVIKKITTELSTRVTNHTGLTSAGHSVKPDILTEIGYYWDLISLGLTKTRDGFYVVATKMGIVVTGKQTIGSNEDNVTSNVIACYTLVDLMTQFWDLESMGIKDSPKSYDDDEALKQFYRTLQYKDNRYVVSRSYKNLHNIVSDDYQLCYYRLKSVYSRLLREHLLDKYDDIIQGQLLKKIIEEVEGEKKYSKVSYLPHHPVITPDKQTTKVRIVYDAAAKTGKNALSLNESLYKGPAILPELCGIMLRFRTSTYGVDADIEKCLKNVCVKKSV